MRPKLHQFCVLLTATILPGNGIQIARSDPKIREQDYIESLKSWLSKTDMPLIFCENSGYDLKNIKKLCNQYPGRVEIIQFTFSEYQKGHDYCYGEYKILEKAMKDSQFIQDSENIIKVTGRVFVENIHTIISNHSDVVFVTYQKTQCLYGHRGTASVCFIYKKEFFTYLESRKNILRVQKMNFEKFLAKALKEAKNNHNTLRVMPVRPIYIGYSGYANMPYKYVYLQRISQIHLYLYGICLRVLKRLLHRIIKYSS